MESTLKYNWPGNSAECQVSRKLERVWPQFSNMGGVEIGLGMLARVEPVFLLQPFFQAVVVYIDTGSIHRCAKASGGEIVSRKIQSCINLVESADKHGKVEVRSLEQHSGVVRVNTILTGFDRGSIDLWRGNNGTCSAHRNHTSNEQNP